MITSLYFFFSCWFFLPTVLPFTSLLSHKNIHAFQPTVNTRQNSNSHLFARRNRKRFNTKQDLVRLESRIRVKTKISSNGTDVILLVDANNVRGVDDFKLTNDDLIRSLASWRRFLGMAKDSIVCVIDHGCQPNAFSFDGITLVFAGPNRTADDVIAHDCQWLSQGEGKHDVLVATSDNELRRRCMASNIKRLNKRPVGHGRGAVEVFSSAQLSSSLKRHWQDVIGNETVGIEVSNQDMSIDALIDLEKDLRKNENPSYTKNQRNLNSAVSLLETDKTTKEDASHIRPLGKKSYIEKTWQRVLTAETIRYALEQRNDTPAPILNGEEEGSLTETIPKYHSMHNSFTGSLKSICFDQRIRYDTTSQQMLIRYMNKSTQPEILEMAALEHNNFLEEDDPNAPNENETKSDKSDDTPITFMRRLVEEAGNKSQTQVVAQYMAEAPTNLQFRKSRDVRTLLANIAVREKRPPLYAMKWYLLPDANN